MSNLGHDQRDVVEHQSPATVPALNDTSIMPMLLKAELDSQIVTARQYPRNIKKAMDNILGLATMDEETAAECLYALVRKKRNRNRNAAAPQEEEGKAIEGPSIRLAEIAAQCWGNNRTVARVVTVNRTEKWVEAVGIFHDLETNQSSEATIRRNISTSSGYLFSADMITVTGNAACSIARRNAILGGIPRGVYRPAYQAARGIVAGTHATLSENREKAIKAFAAFGVTPAQIFEALDIEGEGEIKIDHIATLRAMFMSIKNGEATVEEMFAKPEKTSGDPNYNPLVKDKTGTDPISTGGANEVAREVGNEAGGQRMDSTVGLASANDQARESKETTGAADGSPSERAASGGGEVSAQQSELLSAQHAPGAGSKGEPELPHRQTEGADDSRGEKSFAPDRLRSYSKALLGISSDPVKLGKQSDAWIRKYEGFTGDDGKKRVAIYDKHLARLKDSIDIEACKAQVEEIIGK